MAGKMIPMVRATLLASEPIFKLKAGRVMETNAVSYVFNVSSIMKDVQERLDKEMKEICRLFDTSFGSDALLTRMVRMLVM